MDSSGISDPFAQWRGFYNQAEQAWTDFVQKTISTPAYADMMGRTSQATLNSLEAWRTVAERYLTEVWNLPTRNDLGRLGEVVVAIDAKADDLDDRVDRVEETLTRLASQLTGVDSRLAALAVDGPTRVRERGEALEQRFGGLERRLDDLIARTEQIAKLVEASAVPPPTGTATEGGNPPDRGNGSGRGGGGQPKGGSSSRAARGS